MELKSILNRIVKIIFPLFLGGAILYWMYRGFDFKRIEHVVLYEMNWTWMLLSFPFGILAQMFRGWRWRQTLEPLGEHPLRFVLECGDLPDDLLVEAAPGVLAGFVGVVPAEVVRRRDRIDDLVVAHARRIGRG